MVRFMLHTHRPIRYISESTESYIVNAGGAFKEHHNIILFRINIIRAHISNGSTYTKDRRLFSAFFHFVIRNKFVRIIRIRTHDAVRLFQSSSFIFRFLFFSFFFFAKLSYSAVHSFSPFHFSMAVSPTFRLHYVPFHL